MKVGRFFFVLLIVSTAIFVHELGHFAACRMTGVAVEKFSVGFVTATSTRIGTTEFAVGWVPLGGYNLPLTAKSVQEMEDSGKLDRIADEDPKFAEHLRNSDQWLESASAWERSFIFLSGPIASIILGFVLLSLCSAHVPGFQERFNLSFEKESWIGMKIAWAYHEQVMAQFGQVCLHVFKRGVVFWLSPLRGMFPGRPLVEMKAKEAKVGGPIHVLRYLIKRPLSKPAVIGSELGLLSLNVGALMLIPLPPLDGAGALLALLEWSWFSLLPGFEENWTSIESGLTYVGRFIFYGAVGDIFMGDLSGDKQAVK